MIDRIDNELRPMRAAMNLRAYRQELLASNIANADTPNFKARDIDFKSALDNAMAGKKDGALEIATTRAGHIGSGPNSNPYGSKVEFRTEYQGAVDGNTVNMDIERAAFAENSLQFEALLTFVRGRLGDMRMAMQNQ